MNNPRAITLLQSLHARTVELYGQVDQLRLALYRARDESAAAGGGATDHAPLFTQLALCLKMFTLLVDDLARFQSQPPTAGSQRVEYLLEPVSAASTLPELLRTKPDVERERQAAQRWSAFMEERRGRGEDAAAFLARVHAFHDTVTLLLEQLEETRAALAAAAPTTSNAADTARHARPGHLSEMAVTLDALDQGHGYA
ncbi:hypothetical protein CDCA_CDCA13G3724 [Cyanidium caldarium]|uniref:Mediator of RNA polymerase II transcription subunit 8 n=1 Tax=Cyanidium caldarium TaxID=2771 RepID=A0AAV9IZG4_CYACA|nr:hypothetical protein CDCA_CDCA13G3724 [Cyanidium caldarium]